MKNTISLFLFTLIFTSVYCQKVSVKKGEPQKNKKITNIEGTFTIGGKPFLIVAESNRIIVDYSAVFYPIEDDMSLGEVIRQENINIIDGFMALEKCLYIENIIVNNGKTFLFYTKRNGKNGKVYFVELEEDCKIDESNATEVMQLDLGLISKSTNFTVRQSPDGSKILLAGMVKRTQKSSDYTFKVYSSGMKNLIWEKKFDAAAADEVFRFKGSNYFNTGADQNAINKNQFLVNNNGKVFFLVNRTNIAETKADFSFISIDATGKNLKETEVAEPGNWVGETFFRLNKKGNAEFLLFYSASDAKLEVKMTGSQVDIDAISVLEYDGEKSSIKAQYTLSNDNKSLFFPVKYRKAKGDYLIGSFQITTLVETPNGDLNLVMETPFSTVGRERPFSNTSHGYVCMLTLDSAYKFKTANGFARTHTPPERNYLGTTMSNAFLNNGVLYLFYISDVKTLQCIRFDTPETFKSINLDAKYPEVSEHTLPSLTMLYEKGFIIPIHKEKEIWGSFLGL